jgi:ribose transport system permease protein
VSLTGGRGLPAGLLAGMLSVAVLAEIVAITALPDYYTGLLDAALLTAIVAIDAPGLRRALDRLRARTRSA